ncbi:MAG: L-lactate permease [Anaerolineaceae bacterium]|nr:L-lactate permease [Anaerolineaceae bacterium]
MALTWFNWLLSFLPILLVIVLMIFLKWSGTRAAAAAWFTAALLAFLFFGVDWQLIAWSQAKAFLLSFDILWVVWGAIMLYHLANEGGTIKLIGDLVPLWMKDRTLQILMLTIVLTSFMQGMGGFGVPVAICAPILFSMGFNALDAVVMACLGHAWSVSFGTIGAAFNALVAVSAYPAQQLAPDSAALLGLAIFPCALSVLHISQSWKGIRHGLLAVLLLTAGMGLTQFGMATHGLGNVSVFGAAIVGAGLLFLIRRLSVYKAEQPSAVAGQNSVRSLSGRLVLVSMIPYIILVSLGFLTVTIAPLKSVLESWQISFVFPKLTTSLGWSVSAGHGKDIQPLMHSGTLSFLAILLGGLVYASNGLLRKGSPKRILERSVHTAVEPSLGILTMVGVSQIMSHSGMTSILAKGLGEALSSFLYPAVVPFIGMLGAFLTGSNNNSNVLFAPLHMEAASILRLSIPLMLAAQTAGASIGSVMTPAKVIVGCSTIGLVGKEGGVLKKLLLYDLLIVFFIAVFVLVWSWLGGG